MVSASGTCSMDMEQLKEDSWIVESDTVGVPTVNIVPVRSSGTRTEAYNIRHRSEHENTSSSLRTNRVRVHDGTPTNRHADTLIKSCQRPSKPGSSPPKSHTKSPSTDGNSNGCHREPGKSPKTNTKDSESIKHTSIKQKSSKSSTKVPVGFNVSLEFHESMMESTTHHETSTTAACSSESSDQGNERTKQRAISLDSSDAPSEDASSDDPSEAPQEHSKPTNCLARGDRYWVRLTHGIHRLLLRACLALALRAARMPKRCLGLIGVISVATLAAGFFTNFDLRVNDEDIFAPSGSLPIRHYKWIYGPDTVFKNIFRPVLLLIHTDGNNVLHYEGVERVFEVLDAIRDLPRYEIACQTGSYVNPEGVHTCRMLTATSFWHDNVTLFEEETHGSDQITIDTLSQSHFEKGGTPVYHDLLLGNVQWDNETSPTRELTFAQSLTVAIELPATPDSELLEKDIVTLLLPMRSEWTNEVPAVNPNGYRLEFYTVGSLPDEMTRAINNDLPLLPLGFIIMSGFTCFVFYRRDRVQSRCLLGVGSVVTIVMSIMSGYGVSFLMGIPFTSMTQILPFVIFGVGLDDTFVITGAYLRIDPSMDPVARIKATMEVVSTSICMTTITTVVAFALGCISSVPAIRWLCMYAFITITIDFIYQITFFVAILVLDERRIRANRRDICICCTVSEETPIPDERYTNHDEEHAEEEPTSDERIKPLGSHSQIQARPKTLREPLPDRMMAWFAQRLLHPVVRVCVVLGFTAFLLICGWSAIQMKQSFKASDFLPMDSYVLGFVNLANKYTTESLRIPVYFRDVDQSDPEIQEQMIQYVNDLVALPQIHGEPLFCWVRDFQKFRDGDTEVGKEYSWVFNGNLTFDQQLNLALSLPEVNEIYGYDIARDKNGSIIASRCWLTVHVDLDSVEDQVQFLADQQNVTLSQDVNKSYLEDGSELSFFTFDLLYFLWAFFTKAVKELMWSTISGIVAVSVVGFLLIPHWTAIFFVAPFILVLYVDLIGVLQFAGLRINPLTYVCLVMSVGLLVDFLMHIILRYYESDGITREDKIKDTLRTMGSSVLVGGLSTCFGVIPLAFSSSAILRTVFTAFTAMVTIGVGHGLILLPVILSFLGPTSSYSLHRHGKSEPGEADNSLKASRRSIKNGDTVSQSSTLTNGKKVVVSEEFSAMDSSRPQMSSSPLRFSRDLDFARAGDTCGSPTSLASSGGSPVLRDGGADMILAFLDDVRSADVGQPMVQLSVPNESHFAANSPDDGNMTYACRPRDSTINAEGNTCRQNDSKKETTASPAKMTFEEDDVDV